MNNFKTINYYTVCFHRDHFIFFLAIQYRMIRMLHPHGET